MHSNKYPLHLVEAHLIAAAIVELRGAGRSMVRHGGGFFEPAAVFQIGRDPSRPKRVLPIFVAMPTAAARRRVIA
jgi:hypothetical protein